MDLDHFGPIDDYYSQNSGGMKKEWYLLIGFVSAALIVFIIWENRKSKSTKDAKK